MPAGRRRRLLLPRDAAALTFTPEAVRARCWMIQTMAGVALTDIARVAWVCQSMAAVAWSLALLRDTGFARKVGMAGLLTGALPGVAVVAVGSQMTETVVVGILLVLAVWNLTAATYLVRSGGSSASAATGTDGLAPAYSAR